MESEQVSAPRNTIEENLTWLRQIAKDALERDLVKLNQDLNLIADAIAESVAEIDKEAGIHENGEETIDDPQHWQDRD